MFCFIFQKYVIVIEEELILASDFLYFMSQTHNLLDKDSTVLAISAFNFNGKYYLNCYQTSLIFDDLA